MDLFLGERSPWRPRIGFSAGDASSLAPVDGAACSGVSSGARQPHQAVATMAQNGPSNLAGAGWTAAVRLMGRFGEALQRATGLVETFTTTLTRQQVMGPEGSSLLLQHHQQTMQHTASSEGGGSSGSIPRELVQEEVRRQVQWSWRQRTGA